MLTALFYNGGGGGGGIRVSFLSRRVNTSRAPPPRGRAFMNIARVPGEIIMRGMRSPLFDKCRRINQLPPGGPNGVAHINASSRYSPEIFHNNPRNISPGPMQPLPAVRCRNVARPLTIYQIK